MNRTVARGARSHGSMQSAGHAARQLYRSAPVSQVLGRGSVAGAGRGVATKAEEKDKELRLKDIVSIVSQDTKIVDTDCDKIIRAALGVIEKTVASGGKIQLTGVFFHATLQSEQGLHAPLSFKTSAPGCASTCSNKASMQCCVH